MNQGKQSIFLNRHLEINPNNNALTIAYVNALIESRAYTEAAEMLEEHSVHRPDDHHLWFQLAGNMGASWKRQ